MVLRQNKSVIEKLYVVFFCFFKFIFCLNRLFSSSDDQLEDSDSDEHSRSESVTGMKT